VTYLVKGIMTCIIVIEVGKHNRKCTHNVTMRRVRATIVAVENNTYYIFWVCVCSLRYPTCHLWPVRVYKSFAH